MASAGAPPQTSLSAGQAAASLIASPSEWINRRVETIELLTQEETRRRVSIDFTLSPEQQRALATPDGVVIPIATLTKEARRNFDLCDESGRSVPALSKQQNGDLVLSAVVVLAKRALDSTDISPEERAFDDLLADFQEIVSGGPEDALDAVADFAYDAEQADPIRQALWSDPTFHDVLSTLAEHYVLFAVLPPDGPARRILKYSYGDDFDLSLVNANRASRWRPRELLRRAWTPDRRPFAISCPGASRAASFHVEVAIPEELRICQAVLLDARNHAQLSGLDRNVNRASLYAAHPLDRRSGAIAFVEVAAERSGQAAQAAMTSLVATALLLLGVLSGLETTNPGAAVSILLAGTALYSGFAAASGQHKLVRIIFASRQRWLLVTTVAALTGSATLAMEYPCTSPVDVWKVAAGAASVAALRLMWSAVRSPA